MSIKLRFPAQAHLSLKLLDSKVLHIFSCQPGKLIGGKWFGWQKHMCLMYMSSAQLQCYAEPEAKGKARNTDLPLFKIWVVFFGRGFAWVYFDF